MHVDQLTPALFQFGLLRSDSAAKNHASTYAGDIEFFRSHSGRRMYIREAAIGEWDTDITNLGDWLQVPRLHVLVAQITVGTHTVTPVYRGKAFFPPDVQTDAEVGVIVIEMSRRGGFDFTEMLAFAKDHLPAGMSLQSEIVH
jgi:hypothetical protein